MIAMRCCLMWRASKWLTSSWLSSGRAFSQMVEARCAQPEPAEPDDAAETASVLCADAGAACPAAPQPAAKVQPRATSAAAAIRQGVGYMMKPPFGVGHTIPVTAAAGVGASPTERTTRLPGNAGARAGA